MVAQPEEYGDYGIPWQPHGTNARDIEHFVKYLGYSPLEALRCATRNGYLAMGLGGEHGLVRPGFVADLLLVAGDPTSDVTLLQDARNLRCIVQGARFHKLDPPLSKAVGAVA